MREKSRDSPSPKPWRSRQAMSAPDSANWNSDLDIIWNNGLGANWNSDLNVIWNNGLGANWNSGLDVIWNNGLGTN